MRLTCPCGCTERSDVEFANLEHGHGFGDSLQPVVAMTLPAHLSGRGVDLARCTMGKSMGGCRHQDLPRHRQAHEARCNRLGKSLNLDGLGTARDVIGGITPHHHFAHMDSDARADGLAITLGQSSQLALIVQCKRSCLHRALEHQQETVGLVDLLAAMLVDQPSGQAVMRTH